MPRTSSTFLISKLSDAETFGLGKREQVSALIRNLITEGTLREEDQLPSTRDLARQIEVSRGVVTQVYEELLAEGLIVSKIGAGTFVAKQALSKAAPEAPQVSATKSDWPANVRQGRPFLSRQANLEHFPINVWRKLINTAVLQNDIDMYCGHDPWGYAELRAQISRYLGFSRGIACSPDDILITTGIRHAIDLTLRALARPGMGVAVEDPGYPGIGLLAADLGINTVQVPVDEDGLVVEDLEKTSDRVSACFVTPAHQSPTGALLSEHRRHDLLTWAKKNDAYIFEDDYDGEFSFDRKAPRALKAIDHDDRVIHAGSFNKSLFPTLRIGYMVLPNALKQQLVNLRSFSGRSNSMLEQRAVADFIKNAHFARYIRKMKNVYRDKSALAVQAIQSEVDAELEVLGQNGGFHFLLLLPKGTQIDTLNADLKEHGIDVQFAHFQYRREPRSGIVVGYSSLSDEKITKYGRILGSLIAKY